MGVSLKLFTNLELTIFDEIIQCPKCMISENICNIHLKEVKMILIKNAKKDIKKLAAKN